MFAPVFGSCTPAVHVPQRPTDSVRVGVEVGPHGALAAVPGATAAVDHVDVRRRERGPEGVVGGGHLHLVREVPLPVPGVVEVADVARVAVLVAVVVDVGAGGVVRRRVHHPS